MAFKYYAIMGISLFLQAAANEDEFLGPSQIFWLLYETGLKVSGHLKVSTASLLRLKEKLEEIRRAWVCL